MLEERLQVIKEKLEELRFLDPLGLILFGANHHRYRLNPPASEELLQAFEAEHKLTLPEEYRAFLSKVGNGGAGPYYGLWELKLVNEESYKSVERIEFGGKCLGYIHSEEHPLYEKVRVGNFSSSVRYQDVNWDSSQFEELHQSHYEDFTEVALIIGTEGCNEDILLVVSPNYHGEIWQVWGEEFCGFNWYSPQAPTAISCSLLTEEGWKKAKHLSPFCKNGEFHLSFLDWYEYWLDTGLSQFPQQLRLPF